ncbi:MAG: acetolactate synthase small subunit [archaeon]|jgi:acetolactate synthase-1/3 small subunit
MDTTIEKKHILGLMVEDNPGVMERITGLFFRRGFNIDTIIVGKTANPKVSHIIISLNADDATIEQLEKQASKLIEVIKIIDLGKDSVIREHCLIKINSTPKIRQDILNFCEMHKAKILESNHTSLIIETVGAPEKIDMFIDLMKPFGIKSLSRTGVNALQRKD